MVDCMNAYPESFKQIKKRRLSNLDHKTDDVSPTHILSMAIRKRRELFDQKREPELLRELLNKALIQDLCYKLGQDRTKKARRHKSRSRSASKRRRSQSRDDESLEFKRQCMEDNEDRLQIDESENKGDDYINQGQIDYYTDSNPSMVQTAPDNLDYAQMEKLLDSDQKNPNDYVANWSDHSPTSPPTDNSNSDFPEDPLEMNALFRKLYRQSYSIISPSREETLNDVAELHVRLYTVPPLWRCQLVC
jgi:hypothetical protein